MQPHPLERQPAHLEIIAPVLDSLPDATVLLDRKGIIFAVNEAWRRFGRANGAPAEIFDPIGLDYLAISHQVSGGPDAVAAAEAGRGIRAVLAGTQDEFSLEYPCHSPTERRWFRLNVTPLQGVAPGVLVSHRNITRGKRAELALAASEERYRRLVQNVQIGVVLQGPAAEILLINPKALELLGRTEAELLGKSSFDGDWDIIREDGSRFSGPERPVPRVIATGRPVRNVVMGVRRPLQGDRVWLMVNAEPQYGGDGVVQQVICTFDDITERRRADREKDDASNYVQTLISASPVGIITYKASGQAISANAAVARLVGGTVEQLKAQNFRELASWKSSGMLMMADLALARGEEVMFEEDLVTSYGLSVTGSFRFVPFLYAGERHLLLLTQDISARRRAEMELVKAREHYQHLLRTASDGIHILDPDGNLLEASASFYAMLGYSPDHPPRLRVTDWDAMLTAEELKLRIAGQIAHPQVFATRHRRCNGEVFDVEINAHGILIEGRQYLYASSRDVSARRRAEERLRESEERFRVMFEGSRDAIGVARKGIHLFANPAYLRLFRFASSADLVGTPIVDSIAPCDREKVAQYVRDRAAGKPAPLFYETRGRRVDGTEFDAEYCLSSYEVNGELHMVASIRDISERKQAEAALKRSEEQFRQAQKMEAVGQLAGGVAHDFNNILAAILMYLGLLQTEPALSPSVRSALKELEKDAQRGATLTRQLLAFSRQQAMAPRVLDLMDLLQGLSKMLRRLLGEHIVLTLRGGEALPCVVADAGMVEQVVINLCVNARDAMPRGGQLALRLEHCVLDEGEVQGKAERQAGRFLRLAVEDTGIGMDQEILTHIFEPFFTTKGLGQGTGLGLATVYGIVKQHGGWIEVESEVGRGTRFQVYLPAADAAATAAAAVPATPVVRGRGEVVLLVEDEENLRAAMLATLQHHGYEVFEAANGADALQVWAARRGEFDLLVSDMVMPGNISGRELAERLGAEKPTLKTIICSGYGGQDLLQALGNSPAFTLLQKPFDVPQLLEAVRKRLDGRAPA